MPRVRKRCQVILCGNDYDRIKYALGYFRSNMVYLVANRDSWPKHKKHDEQVKATLISILKDLHFEEKDIKTCEVNYYKFDEALVSLYRLFLELQDEFEIILNVTGGTKLLATAAVVSAMFANVEPIYIAADEYIGDLNAPGKGFKEQPIEISPLFELSNRLLPARHEMIVILEYLLSHKDSGARSVPQMIPPSEIRESRNQGGANKKETQKAYNKIVSKYSYCARQLEKEKLVKEEGHRFHLTPLGELVAKLVNAREQSKKEKK